VKQIGQILVERGRVDPARATIWSGSAALGAALQRIAGRRTTGR